VILSEAMAYSDRIPVLHALANTIKRAQIASKVTIVAKAKVPIVKFVTTHGRFNVDISINQANGVHAGKIVNGFLNDMHGARGLALRSLIMITKLFLLQRGMNEVFSGGLGSYSIVCLAVSFLQMHPKIRRGEIDADKNLGVLLMEFFELYGCYFNYEEVGISVRDGGTYYNKRHRGWIHDHKHHLLSVEDPADPCESSMPSCWIRCFIVFVANDISRGSYGFAKVRAALAGAHGILTSTAYLRAEMIRARREGRYVKLRHRYDPEDLSILSTVMGINQEVGHCVFVPHLTDHESLSGD
jgi:non-canonical poly(A) RNA polymerase PAPD5/7